MEQEFIDELYSFLNEFIDEDRVRVEITYANNQYIIEVSNVLTPDILEIPYMLLGPEYAELYSQKIIEQLDRFTDHYDFTYTITNTVFDITITVVRNGDNFNLNQNNEDQHPNSDVELYTDDDLLF